MVWKFINFQVFVKVLEYYKAVFISSITTSTTYASSYIQVLKNSLLNNFKCFSIYIFRDSLIVSPGPHR